jgi:hypothetical protein
MAESLASNHEKSPRFQVRVMVKKPVPYIVKGLRLKDFKDEQSNRMRIRGLSLIWCREGIVTFAVRRSSIF